jgi:hypothetical protein
VKNQKAGGVSGSVQNESNTEKYVLGAQSQQDEESVANQCAPQNQESNVRYERKITQQQKSRSTHVLRSKTEAHPDTQKKIERFFFLAAGTVTLTWDRADKREQHSEMHQHRTEQSPPGKNEEKDSALAATNPTKNQQIKNGS